jgi:hypothetical protein
MPFIIAIIITVIIIIAMILVFFMIMGPDEKEKVITMSVSELKDDIEDDMKANYQGYDYYYTSFYNSLDPGDTLRLEDIITDIYYNDNHDETHIELGDEMKFFFEGDLTDIFQEDDRVFMIFHIVHYDFDLSLGDTEYRFEGENLKEIWEGDENSLSSDPLPPSFIQHV